MKNTNTGRQIRKRYDFESLDSSAEHQFIHAFVKFIRCNFIQQFLCKTSKGNYRIDFVFEKNGNKYGVEVDGKQHEKSTEYDNARDEAIISEGFVKGIIRIPAWLCEHYRFIAVYYAVSFMTPDFYDLDQLETYIHADNLYINNSSKCGINFVDAEQSKTYNAVCKVKGNLPHYLSIPQSISSNMYHNEHPVCENCGRNRPRAYSSICVDCA